MVTFDEKLWRTRAWTRYQNALASGIPHREVAITRLTSDYTSIGHLRVLVNWCAERTIEVIFYKSEGGIYYPENKRIKINGRLAPEKQVFFLLHECGHHLIGDKEKHERFGMGYSTDDPNVKRTFHHRVDIVDEEFDAWHRGYKLAKRLKIKIHKDHFDKIRSKMLKLYFAWALRVNGYGLRSDDDI